MCQSDLCRLNVWLRSTAAALAVAVAIGCATHRTPAALPAAAPSVEDLLARAEALAAGGCYLCLVDAVGAYSAAVAASPSVSVIRKALENDLMIALREAELRLPDSGAGARAEERQRGFPGEYDAYFAEIAATSGRPFAPQERRDLARRLERDWPATPVSAYFYLTAALAAGDLAELKAELPSMLETHPQDLSLKYKVQSFSPFFSRSVVDDLLSREPRFAELHLVLGQHAIFGAALTDAHRELSAARELLPDSRLITSALGSLELTFGRYPEAIELFDRVLSAGADEPAALGRAIALSNLSRHREAVAVLNDLLMDPRSRPGEKYYWRAWNWLQLSDPQSAYDDAAAALKGMANADVYRLAGIASFDLNRRKEARGYFESALTMRRNDCDSMRYLGLIDAFELQWPAAAARFSAGRNCYRDLVEKLSADAAEKEGDTSGLLTAQVARMREDIAEATSLESVCDKNTTVATRNAALAAAPKR
jgi:tetratricopeptide (TPR) repeat protein